MKLDILNINGKSSGDIEISDKLFDEKLIEHLFISMLFLPFQT